MTMLTRIGLSCFFSCLLISAGFANECARLLHRPAVNALIKKGVMLSQTRQKDYGRLFTSSTCYLEIWPLNTAQVADLVTLAYANHIPIRTQAAGHSQNGSSLPHAFELIIHTEKIASLRFENANRVTSGAGLPILLVKKMIEQHTSFIMPVANDGPIAPTVGGFISSGGISPLSNVYGGFWEHVYSITLVTGYGKVITLHKRNPFFPYLFGSMGQLGIITEVTLNLLPNENRNFLYPRYHPMHLPHDLKGGKFWNQATAPPTLYWLNIFIPFSRLQEARQDLITLQKQYPHALNNTPIHVWTISRISFIPPLVFDKNQTFYSTGLTGYLGNWSDSLEQLNSLNTAFTHLTLMKHYQRYIQIERAGSPALYEKYFSPTVYAQFKKIKLTLDPEFLFNRGSVF